MDFRIKFSLFALIMLGALAVVSAQVDCYSCSYSYTDEDTDVANNCKTPDATTFTTSCASSMSCYVETDINPSSPFPGYITYRRGCGVPEDCHTECTKGPRSCRKCCTANLCNTDTLKSHLSANALTQSCYRCQFSEVPGTRSDSGCGLDFDTSSSRIYEAECPGLCFSAKAKFEHVEDVIRGCIYYGDYCSYDGVKDGNVAPVRDNVMYDLACCSGERCNTATALSVGLVATLLSGLLSAIVTYC